MPAGTNEKSWPMAFQQLLVINKLADIVLIQVCGKVLRPTTDCNICRDAVIITDSNDCFTTVYTVAIGAAGKHIIINIRSSALKMNLKKVT